MPLGPPIQNPDGTWATSPTREPELGKDKGFLTAQQRDSITDWWLAVRGSGKTPTWDIASTAIINGKPGLLLVEAKAHDGELRAAEAGKRIETPVSWSRRRNHVRIGACIQDASLALSEATARLWALSRDWNYQMSNRFAWSWQLAEMGYHVILVYLGFLGAEEMRRPSQRPFANPQQWIDLVQNHSSSLFPEDIWTTPINIHGRTFLPLIRSRDYPLNHAIAEVVP
ncbi:MAG: hypothetical protein ACLQVF_40900 [Isosphaeraceae bacterium]